MIILKALTGMVLRLLSSGPIKALSGMLAAAALRPEPNRTPAKPASKANRTPRSAPSLNRTTQLEPPQSDAMAEAISLRIAAMMPDGWRCMVVRSPDPRERVTMMRLRVWTPGGREWGYECAVSDLVEARCGKVQVWLSAANRLERAAEEIIIQDFSAELQDAPIQNHPRGYPDLVPAYGHNYAAYPDLVPAYGKHYAEYPSTVATTTFCC